MNSFSKKYFYIYIYILLIFSSLIYADEISFFKRAVCGVPKLSLQEEKIKGIPARKLTRKEMEKRGRIFSITGRIQYDILEQEKLFWNFCQFDTSWQQTKATCKKITDDIYLYVANDIYYDPINNTSGYITQSDLEEISYRFSTDTTEIPIYKRTRQVFGEEEEDGIDGDPHLTILLLDIDNDLISNKNWFYNRKAWVGGYFTLLDGYPDGENGIHSNERKIIYIDSYPTFEHGSIAFEYDSLVPRSLTPDLIRNDDDEGIYFPEGNDAVQYILAHEFQHKIHNNFDPEEEKWINEGCSELAGIVNNIEPYRSHIQAFLKNSNENLIEWADTQQDYGVVLLFLTYLYDHFGGENFINSLVKNKEKGIDSLNNNLAKYKFSDTFEGIFINWSISNYLNDSSINPDFVYKSINISDSTFFITTPKKSNVLQYGIQPVIRYTAYNNFETKGSVNGYANLYYTFIPAYETSNIRFYFENEDENNFTLETRVGIKKADNSYELKYLQNTQENAKDLIIENLNITQIKELVFIVTNKGSNAGNFTFNMSPISANKPFAPIKIIATGGVGEINLEWEKNNGNITMYESTSVNSSTYIKYVFYYNLYRSDKYNEGFTLINSDPLDASGYTDTNVKLKNRYYYRLKTVMYKLVVINGVVSAPDSSKEESVYSSYASAIASAPLKQKVRSRCFITERITKNSEIIKRIILFRDKYLANSFVSKIYYKFTQ